MTDKKVHLVVVFAIILLLCLYLSVASPARAYSINVNLNTDEITSALPTPITDLINSAKQIWQNFTGGSASAPIPGPSGNTTNFTNSLQNTNIWLINTTGLSFTQIVKAIGGFIAWVFTFISNLIKQGLSLI
jgi:hypothetical protein